MQRLIIAIILLASLLTGCAPTAVPTNDAPTPTATPAVEAPKTPQALQPTPVSTALFQVVKADGSSVGFTWEDLKKLPVASLTIEGKVQEGVTLSAVLTAAGVTDFSEVTLTGSASPVTLTKAQVDDNTLLDFNNHGTVKLATTYVAKAQWTKDVARIEVK
jgi:hypothetical protein